MANPALTMVSSPLFSGESHELDFIAEAYKAFNGAPVVYIAWTIIVASTVGALAQALTDDRATALVVSRSRNWTASCTELVARSWLWKRRPCGAVFFCRVGLTLVIISVFLEI